MAASPQLPKKTTRLERAMLRLQPMLLDSQIEEYRTRGFCVAPDLLVSESKGLLAGIEAISAGSTLAHHDSTRLEMEPNQAAEGTKVRRIYDPCTHYDLFRDLACGDKLVDCAAQLLGDDVLFFSSKVNIKPPEIGSVVEWHQDMAYGPLTNRSVVAVLIYLDDADSQNGCLQVIPGQQRMLDHSLKGVFQGRVTEPLDPSKAIAIEGGRGTAIFFNGLVPHASSTNQSPRPRRTLILGYRAADAFPIHLGAMTAKADQFVRLVRGQFSSVARFDMDWVFIPRYPADSKSLYDLQERARVQEIGSRGSVVGN
jgi:phytanoyl-CoA hydroxylase